ncbi:MAG: methylenetetrahydrofolate reductase C-terminal domain-containing protein [Candidatus Omnitrophota bacterium]
MIITKQKDPAVILEYLKDSKKIFLVGCNLCATICKTGGEYAIEKTRGFLTDNGKTITGSAILDPACNILEVKRFYRKHSKEIDASDAILSLACGGGTQTLTDIITGKDIFPANDTLFQGEIAEKSLKQSRFEQKCSLCGDCMLGLTGGICPITRCPKSLINGPCGGVIDGKCEVDRQKDCVWILIYKKLKETGKLHMLKETRPLKDHSKNKHPQDLTIK